MSELPAEQKQDGSSILLPCCYVLLSLAIFTCSYFFYFKKSAEPTELPFFWGLIQEDPNQKDLTLLSDSRLDTAVLFHTREKLSGRLLLEVEKWCTDEQQRIDKLLSKEQLDSIHTRVDLTSPTTAIRKLYEILNKKLSSPFVSSLLKYWIALPTREKRIAALTPLGVEKEQAELMEFLVFHGASPAPSLEITKHRLGLTEADPLLQWEQEIMPDLLDKLRAVDAQLTFLLPIQELEATEADPKNSIELAQNLKCVAVITHPYEFEITKPELTGFQLELFAPSALWQASQPLLGRSFLLVVIGVICLLLTILKKKRSLQFLHMLSTSLIACGCSLLVSKLFAFNSGVLVGISGFVICAGSWIATSPSAYLRARGGTLPHHQSYLRNALTAASTLAIAFGVASLHSAPAFSGFLFQLAVGLPTAVLAAYFLELFFQSSIGHSPFLKACPPQAVRKRHHLSHIGAFAIIALLAYGFAFQAYHFRWKKLFVSSDPMRPTIERLAKDFPRVLHSSLYLQPKVKSEHPIEDLQKLLEPLSKQGLLVLDTKKDALVVKEFPQANDFPVYQVTCANLWQKNGKRELLSQLLGEQIKGSKNPPRFWSFDYSLGLFTSKSLPALLWSCFYGLLAVLVFLLLLCRSAQVALLITIPSAMGILLSLALSGSFNLSWPITALAAPLSLALGISIGFHFGASPRPLPIALHEWRSEQGRSLLNCTLLLNMPVLLILVTPPALIGSWNIVFQVSWLLALCTWTILLASLWTWYGLRLRAKDYEHEEELNEIASHNAE